METDYATLMLQYRHVGGPQNAQHCVPRQFDESNNTIISGGCAAGCDAA
jgi:hypothetical protein